MGEGGERGWRQEEGKKVLIDGINQAIRATFTTFFYIFFKGPVDEIQWHLMAGLRTAGAKAFSVRLDNEDQSFCF